MVYFPFRGRREPVAPLKRSAFQRSHDEAGSDRATARDILQFRLPTLLRSIGELPRLAGQGQALPLRRAAKKAPTGRGIEVEGNTVWQRTARITFRRLLTGKRGGRSLKLPRNFFLLAAIKASR